MVLASRTDKLLTRGTTPWIRNDFRRSIRQLVWIGMRIQVLSFVAWAVGHDNMGGVKGIGRDGEFDCIYCIRGKQINEEVLISPKLVKMSSR